MLCVADEQRREGNLPFPWTTGCRSQDPQPQCSHCGTDTCVGYSLLVEALRSADPPSRLFHTRSGLTEQPKKCLNVLLASVRPVCRCVYVCVRVCALLLRFVSIQEAVSALRSAPLLTAPAGYFTVFMLLSGAVGIFLIHELNRNERGVL